MEPSRPALFGLPTWCRIDDIGRDKCFKVIEDHENDVLAIKGRKFTQYNNIAAYINNLAVDNYDVQCKDHEEEENF